MCGLWKVVSVRLTNTDRVGLLFPHTPYAKADGVCIRYSLQLLVSNVSYYVNTTVTTTIATVRSVTL